MTRLTGNKPENSRVLSHHSNNKTNVLPTFQVHNLLTGTLRLSTFFIHKNDAKIKKTLKRDFIRKKSKNVFFYIYGSYYVVSTSASDWLERLVSEMTYNVSMGTLNPIHSLTHSLTHSFKQETHPQ